MTITVGGTPQSGDPLGNPFMFTSRFQDEETGLMYYRARTYSPATGRFLQRDPLGYGPGANVYEYVRSLPTVLRDPFGLAPKHPGTFDSKACADAFKKCPPSPRDKCIECCRTTAEQQMVAAGQLYDRVVEWCETTYEDGKKKWESNEDHLRSSKLIIRMMGTLSTLATAATYTYSAIASWPGLADDVISLVMSWAAPVSAAGEALVGSALAEWSRTITKSDNKWVKCITDASRTQRWARSTVGKELGKCLERCCKKNQGAHGTGDADSGEGD